MTIINHPDLKGSFTCLGNPYNLQCENSMAQLASMLTRQNFSNHKVALSEIIQAVHTMYTWKRDPVLGFLYREYPPCFSCDTGV